jgi:hypothetical protein
VFICSTRNLMVGKNPLWVAKQHGHSIATMLRAYAAWAEDTAEVDVEAIKRSMNATEAPPAINLAVDLSVAEALQVKRRLANRSTRTVRSCANRLFRRGELAENQTKEKLAGVAGFEPTNGGIKTLEVLMNQQVIVLIDSLVPWTPLRAPSLEPKLAPEVGCEPSPDGSGDRSGDDYTPLKYVTRVRLRRWSVASPGDLRYCSRSGRIRTTTAGRIGEYKGIYVPASRSSFSRRSDDKG